MRQPPDVRSKIEQVRRNLPSAAGVPTVQQFDPSAQPIVSLALASKQTDIADSRQSPRERCSARWKAWVAWVAWKLTAISGARSRSSSRSSVVEALDITPQQVIAALAQQNVEIPAGRIPSRNGEQLVRIVGRVTEPSQFGSMIQERVGTRQAT